MKTMSLKNRKLSYPLCDLARKKFMQTVGELTDAIKADLASDNVDVVLVEGIGIFRRKDSVMIRPKTIIYTRYNCS